MSKKSRTVGTVTSEPFGLLGEQGGVFPPRSTSSSCVPSSVIRPSSTTTILSARSDAGKAMRDDYRGMAGGHVEEMVVEIGLLAGIEVRRGLVEDQDRRSRARCVQRSRESDALPFATGHVDTAELSRQAGVPALWERLDQLECTRLSCRRLEQTLVHIFSQRVRFRPPTRGTE